MDDFWSEMNALVVEMMKEEALSEDEALSAAYYALPSLLGRAENWDTRSLWQRWAALTERVIKLEGAEW